MIAPPLRLHDCSLITDGAAAVVLTSSENAKSNFKHAVELSGIGHVTDRMMLNGRQGRLHELQATKHAVTQGLHSRQVLELAIWTLQKCMIVSP